MQRLGPHMHARRAAAVTSLALGLALGSSPAWADEAAPDPGCTTYPVDETDPGAGGGEATAEPGPVEESPVVDPAPSEEPVPSEEPAPEETGEPPAEPTEEPPVEATEEPPVEPTKEPEPSAGPSDEPGPEPSEYVVCLYAASGEAVRDTSTGAAETAGSGAVDSMEQLPRTGAASVDLVGFGAGLVLLGSAAVAVGRRRHA